MTVTYYQKPQPDKPMRQSNGRVRYVSCHHIISRGPHQGKRCYAPTENGKHACPDCLKEEKTIRNPNIRDTIRTYID